MCLPSSRGCPTSQWLIEQVSCLSSHALGSSLLCASYSPYITAIAHASCINCDPRAVLLVSTSLHFLCSILSAFTIKGFLHLPFPQFRPPHIFFFLLPKLLPLSSSSLPSSRFPFAIFFYLPIDFVALKKAPSESLSLYFARKC